MFFSIFCSAQNSGSINGIVLDGEAYNEPLIFANVSIKETATNISSDENGLFHFENLAEGNYTLIVNFIGYESKELKVQIASDKPINISVSLLASTVSLNDFSSLNIVAKQDSKRSKSIND